LAEAGIRSDWAIRVHGASFDVEDIVRCVLAETTPEQRELEWTAVGLAHYLPPGKRWRNRFGQELSFDVLVDRLCSEPPGRGPCFGTHRLYAVATLLAADKATRLLGPDSRQAAVQYLQGAVDALRESQREDGSWDAEWANASWNRDAATDMGQAIVSVVVTGHTLEWQHLVPAALQLERERVDAALLFLTLHLERTSDDSVREHYSPLSHAANAIRLWNPDCRVHLHPDRPVSAERAL
jgi:hypothetical protein